MRKGKNILPAMGMFLIAICLSSICLSCNSSDKPERKVIEFKTVGKDWETIRNFQESYHYYIKEIPELTEEIFRRGGASVYFLYNKDHKLPLPYLKTFSSGGNYYTEYLQYSIQLGENGQPSTIQLRLVATDLGLYSAYPPDMTFRVILEMW